ncbi:MAG TPA: protein translocase subunit SecD [bacterium]|nr:protein translocase subunit SecD [bacterium]
MQKKLLPQLVLVFGVLFLFSALLIWTYQSRTELRTELITVNGEQVERTVEHKLFPVNLGLDLQGGVHFLVEALAPKGEVLTEEKMRGLVEVLRNRLDPEGVRELVIQKQGTNRVLIEIPGEQDAEQAERNLTVMAFLQFVDTRGQFLEDGARIAEDAKIMLTGDDLKMASVDYQYGRPVVAFEFKKNASEVFAKFTSRNVNKYLAITLDGVVISCPVIKTAILTGRGIIEGSFSEDEVREMVDRLNAGRLPLKVVVREKRVVGPTLGAESIRQSLFAGMLGVFLVLVFMAAYYRLPGFIADIALVFYIVIIFGMMTLLHATLTLPGIAGFILSIGMAVDANIIIFERLREEIRIGKTFLAALDAGFSRAFTAILDANVTTLIATIALYSFGTGPIRGFAVTLSLGIVVSMFSAIMITRLFLMIVAKMKVFQSYGWYGVKPISEEHAANQRQLEG